MNSEIRVENNQFDVSIIDKEMEMIKKELDENKIIKKSKNIFLDSKERDKINTLLKSPGADKGFSTFKRKSTIVQPTTE